MYGSWWWQALLSWIHDEQETWVDQYKPPLLPGDNPDTLSLLSVLPTMTSICSCSQVKDTTSRMCSPPESTSSAEVLPGTTTHLIPFQVDGNQQDLQVRLTSIFQLVNVSTFLMSLWETLYFLNVSPVLKNICPIPCYGRTPLILVILAPSGTSVFILPAEQIPIKVVAL